MATLLEKYSNRLAIAESYYAKQHDGAKMDNHRKLITARCLDNVNRFLAEAFENSVGTQRSDLGMWKKFCLNLSNVVVPNLIAPELVLTQPMSSMSGYITYIEYTAGTTKGGVNQGDYINGVFKMGDMTEARRNYTGTFISETAKVADGETSTKLAWGPIDTATIKVKVGGTDYTVVTGDVEPTAGQVHVTKEGVLTFADEVTEANVLYTYDNIVIPQNDLPVLNARVQSKALVAKARRIAVYYSQIAAFQAKTDYGFDLGDQLAEQAAGELAYEIDSEVVNLLLTSAPEDVTLTFDTNVPVGISRAQHYEAFAEVIEKARAVVYNRTQKFMPNYMIVGADMIPVLTFVTGFKAAPVNVVAGPYFAGTLNGMKVFVSPMLKTAENKSSFVIGVNGNDMMTSAAVYAPYMPIVPTQLLQYADGGNSQGFSTMYALELLSTDENGKSPLLVKGEITLGGGYHVPAQQ